jgi:hypothetical protein
MIRSPPNGYQVGTVIGSATPRMPGTIRGSLFTAGALLSHPRHDPGDQRLGHHLLGGEEVDGEAERQLASTSSVA